MSKFVSRGKCRKKFVGLAQNCRVALVRFGKIKYVAKVGRLVRGFAALFILRRDSQTALPKIALSADGCTVGLLGLLITVCGLAKGGIFSTKVHTKHKCLFNHKSFYEARNPAFCQTAVSSSGSLFFRHFDSFRILNAPCPTMKNTIVPTIRSGYFEFVK